MIFRQKVNRLDKKDLSQKRRKAMLKAEDKIINLTTSEK
jgi:hypothetical protein